MANTHLTQEELEIVLNSTFILTKNKIISDVRTMFAELSHQYQERAQLPADHLLSKVFAPMPKISRGEQYQGLPYVVLDYPRVFGVEDTIAVRSFFWWGHYFSISILLKGQYQWMLQEKYLSEHFGEWLLDISDSPWNHDNASCISVANYLQAASRVNLPFLKITRQLPLTEWENSQSFWLGMFERLVAPIIGYRH